MDFFAHQDAARRSTSRLVAFFVLAVVLIVVSVYLAVLLIFFGVESQTGVEAARPLWDPQVFFATAAATLAVIFAGSLYKIFTLREGGEAVARLLGGRPVDPKTTDLAERRLLNVVEEMALAAGVPVPPVFLLDKEKGINAFAAGFTPNDAVIGVTDGCINLLSRDQLQGVIAHEFSHVLNGDMRLNLRLMGILHGILVIALIGYFILRSLRFSGGGRRRSGGGKKDGGGSLVLAILLFAVVLLVVGYVGVFFGRLIKSAVSRQREYLADASAVQFTRNPLGIAGALKKIGGWKAGSRLEAPKAEEASHMFFGNALKKSLFAALSTHPPLDDRIRRIDPSFDGELPAVAEEGSSARTEEELAQVFGLAGDAGPEAAAEAPGSGEAVASAVAAAAAAEQPASVTPHSVSDHAGTLSAAHVAYAARLLAAIPEELKERAREPTTAPAVIYALLLHRDDEPRRRQLAELERRTDAFLYDQTVAALPWAERCPVEARLPLVDLAVPALGRRTATQHDVFTAAVQALVAADGRIDLFEYTLQRLLLSHLEPRFHRVPPPRVRHHRPQAIAGQAGLLLSALAHSGHGDRDGASRAVARGAGELGLELDLRPRDECGMAAIDDALGELSRTAPALKRRVLRAATATVADDGRVTLAEGELLRAVGDSLGVPVPPFLPGQTAAA